MILPLILGFAIVAIAALVTGARFGFDLVSLVSGDGQAVLAVASAILNIWTITFGASLTAIGAAFELSPLNIEWKLQVAVRKLPRVLFPFFVLGGTAGLIAFLTLLNVDHQVSVVDAQVGAWLPAGLLLQVLLLYVGARAAWETYRTLGLVAATKCTLRALNGDAVETIAAEHRSIAQRSHASGEWRLLDDGLGPQLGQDAGKLHTELMHALEAVVLHENPQVQSAAISDVTTWANNLELKPLDGYLRHYVLPSLCRTVDNDPATANDTVFALRLQAISRLVACLGQSGATLTEANSANDLWGVIAARAKNAGMADTLAISWRALNPLLRASARASSRMSIHLWNLARAARPLAQEGTPRALAELETIVSRYIEHLRGPFCRDWPRNRDGLEQILDQLSHVFADIDVVFENRPAIWAQVHDVRYWILIGLRRSQEAFAEQVITRSPSAEEQELARLDFDLIGRRIEDLGDRRSIHGDSRAYEAVKYRQNPFDIPPPAATAKETAPKPEAETP